MILSVSRRTDIPNYYAEWFLRRIEEGFLYVRNPMNAHQVSRIDLSPDIVDCIVFWTKNPANMMAHLERLRDYLYYFQFTLTPYGKETEPGLPDKKELLTTFRKLSEKIGKERVIWRYDPIFLSDKYTVEHHLEAFGEMADALAGYTEKVVISFIDMYAKTKRNMAGLGMLEMTKEDMFLLAAGIAGTASEHQLSVETCAEQITLQNFGIRHGSCIDKNLIERLAGCTLAGAKDKNQRKECGCLESVEVGTYHTCLNGCKYCYANFQDAKVRENAKLYDVDSPLLCGSIGPEDKITVRKVRTLKDGQLSLFDQTKRENGTES